jgi:hypothetical protein
MLLTPDLIVTGERLTNATQHLTDHPNGHPPALTRPNDSLAGVAVLLPYEK